MRLSRFKHLAFYLSKVMTYDFRNLMKFLNILNFKINFINLIFKNMTASLFTDYIIRRLNLKYEIRSVVFSLINEITKEKVFKGFFIKFVGRYTKKPRAMLNKKIFKYGKIGFSTINSNIDYSFKRFESKFGTCSIKL